MKNSNPHLRCFDSIINEDLNRLLEIAKRDRDQFFEDYPDWGALYADRILGTALCQGSALHYTGANVGINDFDVYTFYAAHPDRDWYAKRIKRADFGDPKFGRSEISPRTYIGRRVDLMGRSLRAPPGSDVVEALVRYLSNAQTRTAKELASKAVVMIEPRIGWIVWPQSAVVRRNGN